MLKDGLKPHSKSYFCLH